LVVEKGIKENPLGEKPRTKRGPFEREIENCAKKPYPVAVVRNRREAMTEGKIIRSQGKQKNPKDQEHYHKKKIQHRREKKNIPKKGKSGKRRKSPVLWVLVSKPADCYNVIDGERTWNMVKTHKKKKKHQGAIGKGNKSDGRVHRPPDRNNTRSKFIWGEKN